MSIYICGPMTGLKEFNYPEFNRVAEKLRKLGRFVINPVEICSHLDGKNAKHQDYMNVCIPAIAECNTILLLNGWQTSAGAKEELAEAMRLGKAVVMQWELKL